MVIGSPPLTSRDVFASRVNDGGKTSVQETLALTRVAQHVARAGEVGLQEAEQRLHRMWANNEFSVIKNVDFSQLFADTYGDRWKTWQRGLNESRESFGYRSALGGISEAMASDNFSNLLTTVIRYGVIEAAELVPMPLRGLVNSSLRIAPGNVDVPVQRSVADIVDDGVAEWEPTLFKGVPTPNMVRIPKARKLRLAFRMSREMAAVDAVANTYIRNAIDAHAEAFNLHAEKLLADLMFGLYDTATPGANPFPHILDGIQYNTFTTGAPWTNDLTGAALDGTQVPFELLMKTIEGIVDPYSGELVDYGRAPKIVVNNENARQLAMDALGGVHLVRDTTSVGGSARQELDRVAGSTRFSVGVNDIVVSRNVRPRLEAWLQTTAGGSNNANDAKTKAGTTWLYGDTMRAFAYGTEWERERVQRGGTDTPEYFQNETVLVVKWVEKSTPVVMDPIRVVRCRT